MLYSLPSAITERSPISSFFGGSAEDLHLHDVLFRKLLEPGPAKIALHLIGRRHDGAAIAGMRLDDLALPFRIEQIGKTLRRLLGLHQIGVVGDDAEPDAPARKLAVHILVFRGIKLRDVFRHVRRKVCRHVSRR